MLKQAQYILKTASRWRQLLHTMEDPATAAAIAHRMPNATEGLRNTVERANRPLAVALRGEPELVRKNLHQNTQDDISKGMKNYGPRVGLSEDRFARGEATYTNQNLGNMVVRARLSELSGRQPNPGSIYPGGTLAGNMAAAYADLKRNR